MNMNSKSGSGSASFFFVILFLASVALNVAFVTGCISTEVFQGGSKGPTPPPTTQTKPGASESYYLREIAASLGLSPSLDKTPGDIAFDLKQALGNSLKYRDDILSDEAFQDCKAAIPTTKDTATFEAYHVFIKKIAGKRILVLDK